MRNGEEEGDGQDFLEFWSFNGRRTRTDWYNNGPMNGRPFDGNNLWPVLRGETKESFPGAVVLARAGDAAILDGEWKLIEKRETSHPHLFRIFEDPYEERDLSAEQPEVVRELSAKIRAMTCLMPLGKTGGGGRGSRKGDRRKDRKGSGKKQRSGEGRGERRGSLPGRHGALDDFRKVQQPFAQLLFLVDARILARLITNTLANGPSITM